MKLPFDLGVKLFFRLLIPGFFLTLGLTPALESLWDATGWPVKREYAIVLVVLLMGWIITSLDMFIYMLFEGRRFWPEPVRDSFLEREKSRLTQIKARMTKIKVVNAKKAELNNIKAALEDAAIGDDQRHRLEKEKKELERVILTELQQYREASTEIIEFPFDDEGQYEVQYPTRLGNLLTAYETYPDTRYGEMAIFYWPWVWLSLPKDIREEIDNRQAVADSAVYTSFAMFCASLCWLIYTIATARGIKINFVTNVWVAALVFLFFLVTGYGVYRMAVYLHGQYSDYFKAMFDLHGKNIEVSKAIDEIIGITKNMELKTAKRSRQLRTAWLYLEFYRVPCPIPGCAERIIAPPVFDKHLAAHGIAARSASPGTPSGNLSSVVPQISNPPAPQSPSFSLSSEDSEGEDAGEKTLLEEELSLDETPWGE